MVSIKNALVMGMIFGLAQTMAADAASKQVVQAARKNVVAKKAAKNKGCKNGLCKLNIR